MIDAGRPVWVCRRWAEISDGQHPDCDREDEGHGSCGLFMLRRYKHPGQVRQKGTDMTDGIEIISDRRIVTVRVEVEGRATGDERARAEQALSAAGYTGAEWRRSMVEGYDVLATGLRMEFEVEGRNQAVTL